MKEIIKLRIEMDRMVAISKACKQTKMKISESGFDQTKSKTNLSLLNLVGVEIFVFVQIELDEMVNESSVNNHKDNVQYGGPDGNPFFQCKMSGFGNKIGVHSNG